MLTINMSHGTDAQYSIPDDVADFVNDFSENARDIVVDDAYNGIINELLTDLFNNKLPNDGQVSEDDINDLIRKMYFGESTGKYRSLGDDAQYWIHDYVMYGLYLGDASKFKFTRNYDSARGVRMTGDNSGYMIELNYNNQGIDHQIFFQITSVSADLIHVQGGIPGGDYVDKDLDAKSAIELLLKF